MTHRQFFDSIQNYYGKYPRDGMRQDIVEYLKTEVPPEELDELAYHIKHTISSRYSFVPDIEAIETARREIRNQPIESRPHQRQLPDPLVRSMDIEIGGIMRKILNARSLRRHGYGGDTP